MALFGADLNNDERTRAPRFNGCYVCGVGYMVIARAVRRVDAMEGVIRVKFCWLELRGGLHN